jgi:hypothetical protein
MVEIRETKRKTVSSGLRATRTAQATPISRNSLGDARWYTPRAKRNTAENTEVAVPRESASTKSERENRSSAERRASLKAIESVPVMTGSEA